MTTLLRATNEWSSRPPDQRFASLADLDAAVGRYRQIAGVGTVPYTDDRVTLERAAGKVM